MTPPLTYLIRRTRPPAEPIVHRESLLSMMLGTLSCGLAFLVLLSLCGMDARAWRDLTVPVMLPSERDSQGYGRKPYESGFRIPGPGSFGVLGLGMLLGLPSLRGSFRRGFPAFSTLGFLLNAALLLLYYVVLIVGLSHAWWLPPT